MDPGFPPSYQFLAAAYEQKGQLDEAIVHYKDSPMINRSGEWTFTKGGLGHAYAVNGQRQDAFRMISELKELSKDQFVPASSIALIYVRLGMNDEAFNWLEKGYESREFQLQWLAIEPRWHSLRTDPRFTELIRRIGLPPTASGQNANGS